MAARSKVFIEDDGGDVRLWKTDLSGYGDINEGDEFIIRELSQYGRSTLVKDGIKRRIRVVDVNRQSRSFHILKVEILEELSPPNGKSLFD